jgi:uncharacterized RDD family membrane protein YckC
MTDAQRIRPGNEQLALPQAPPGMYLDPASGLVLPQGVKLASRTRVAAALILGLLLFCVTAGIGYIGWSVFTWGQGRTPAQRILNLRCWLTQDGRVAGRDEMRIRQVLGFFFCGGLIWGFFVWLLSKNRRSAGDLLAGTVVLHDPDGVLASSTALSRGPPAPVTITQVTPATLVAFYELGISLAKSTRIARNRGGPCGVCQVTVPVGGARR